MKIVDLDALTKPVHSALAAKWIADSFVPIKTETGIKSVPNEAIYFFSTDKTPAYLKAQKLGLLHDRIPRMNYWNGQSISQLLTKMVGGLNEIRKKYGMRPQKKFCISAPSRVVVLTLREFDSIEKIGAIPMPFEIVRPNANN